MEINAACWKVIDHLVTFAKAIIDAHAREYLTLYPEYVRSGDFLATEIGPEITKRTKLHWTRWETAVDLAIQSRWPPHYYRAYVEEGNQPDSEDQKVLADFIRRLEETVAGRVRLWQEQEGLVLQLPTIVAEPVSASESDRGAVVISDLYLPGGTTGADAAPQDGGALSSRDERVHGIVGESRFGNLTNSEILSDRSLSKLLREQFGLKRGDDATKSCFDRIRRARRYPLSREIAKNGQPSNKQRAKTVNVT